ncbi:hypothetical protein LCGC14_0566730 [marine sediment metagenome]|uniref:Uncharacterized protein n=1 Tax=marine sediment metagenome TaxID=412755 RepID=A0A0F9U6M6_9ZZZZ
MNEDKIIMVSYGKTVSDGNYGSERIQGSLTLPLEEEFEVQFDKMFRKIKMKVLGKAGILPEIEGETSEIVGKPMISTNQTDRNELKVDSAASKPLETTKENELKRSLYPETKGIDFQKLDEKTAVKETRNFVDVRKCKNYSDKSYKLIGFDMKYTFIAKQHVIRTEVILGGGTRVLVSPKSAWVLTKLEWK